MKFLKNRKAALIILALVVLGMSVLGISKAPTRLPEVKSGQWVYDGAGVLSAQEEQYLTQGNARFRSEHGAVVAVATMPEVKNRSLGDFCGELAEEWGLTGGDFILVLDIGGDNYWLLQGGGLMDHFTDDMAKEYTRQYLEHDFAARQYGAGAVRLFDALEGWYDGFGGQGEGIADPDEPDDGKDGGGRFGPVLLILPAAVVLAVAADALRYVGYRRRWFGANGAGGYRPFIFGRPRRTRKPGPSRPSGPASGGSRPSSGSFGGGRH